MSMRSAIRGLQVSGNLSKRPRISLRIATPGRHLSTHPTAPSDGSTSKSTPQITPSSRLTQYYPRLVQLSTRTGVPLPSLAISFLILHEITALVPVFLFFWLFQALGVGSGLLLWIKGQAGVNTSPSVSVDGHGPSESRVDGRRMGEEQEEEQEESREGKWKGVVRGWYEEAEVKVGKIGSRYGIFGYEKRDRSKDSTSDLILNQGGDGRAEDKGEAVRALVKKDGTAGGTIANAISAYIVVKALLPVRIAASIGLAPAFARFALNPIHRLYTRYRTERVMMD